MKDTANTPDVPHELNQILEKVLAYRPKPKSKGAKKRTRKKKKIEKQREPGPMMAGF